KERFDRDHAKLVAPLERFEREQLPQRAEQRAKNWNARPDQFNPVLVDSIARGVRWSGLAKWAQTTDPEWRRLKQRGFEHSQQAPVPRIVKALIASEGLPPLRLHTQGADFYRECYFLRRGDPDQKDGVAPQGFVQVLVNAPESEKHWQTPPPKGWRTSYR